MVGAPIHSAIRSRGSQVIARMNVRIAKDEITPALARILQNTSPARRMEILGHLAFSCVNQQKKSIAAELQYDGAPMKSPAKETKFGGRFAKSYNWRYREGYRLMTDEERVDAYNARVLGKNYQKIHRSTFIDKKGYAQFKERIRRRVPVTAASKQLQDTGATIKSIDILSINAQVARVGPKTGHGQLILSVHDSTRHPLGMSEEWKQRARETAMSEIMKGV